MPRKLTPEQRAENKKRSQAKWLEKQRLQAEQKSDSTPTTTPEIIRPNDLTTLDESPTTPRQLLTLPRHFLTLFDTLSFVFPILLCVSITSLLVYFQAQAYSDGNLIKPLDCAVSIVCEISLLYLSASLRHSFASWVLFLALFVYNLGVMTFAVRRDETKKTLTEIREDPKETMKRDLFQRALVSYDLSAMRKESGNMNKSLSLMKEVSAEREVKEEKPMIELYKIEAFGLIVLRAILMLLNALLIHRIFNAKSETMEL